MKNLSTLGGLLIAALVLDTTHLLKELPVQFENRQIPKTSILESTGIAEGTKPDEKNVGRESGIFYASKLFWSEANHRLYVMGDKVRVDVSGNKGKREEGRGRGRTLKGASQISLDAPASC